MSTIQIFLEIVACGILGAAVAGIIIAGIEFWAWLMTRKEGRK